MDKSKKSKRDKRESEEKDKKKSKSSDKKDKEHKKSKSHDSSSKDKKRKNNESEDEELVKKSKKNEAPAKPAQATRPPLPIAAVPSKPADAVVSAHKFAIPSNLNTQAVPPKPVLHKFHWRKMLSKEILERLELTRVVQFGQSDYLEGGWSVGYKDDDGKMITWKCSTPVLRVANATLHGIGLLGPDKTEDDERVYKLKLEANLLAEIKDPETMEILKLDPELEKEQREYTEGVDLLTQRIGWLLFHEAKQLAIKSIYERNLTKIIEKQFEEYLAKHVEKTHKIIKPIEELSDKEKKNLTLVLLSENIEEYKASKEAQEECFSDFLAGMTTYVFNGDEKYPKDIIPTFRQQTKAFYQKKQLKSSKDEPHDGALARKLPDKFSGSKGKASKGGGKKELKDLKDEESGKTSDTDESYMMYDDEDARYDDLPDEKVNATIAKMRKHRYIHRRFAYYNHDGTLMNLGAHIHDRNYRVLDQGDLVQSEWSLWLYSLSGDKGRYGYKQQLGTRLSLIRKGIPKRDIPVSEGSKLGRLEELRPKELMFSAALPSEPVKVQKDAGAHESEESSSDSDHE